MGWFTLAMTTTAMMRVKSRSQLLRSDCGMTRKKRMTTPSSSSQMMYARYRRRRGRGRRSGRLQNPFPSHLLPLLLLLSKPHHHRLPFSYPQLLSRPYHLLHPLSSKRLRPRPNHLSSSLSPPYHLRPIHSRPPGRWTSR